MPVGMARMLGVAAAGLTPGMHGLMPLERLALPGRTLRRL
jgi:hypothetical protein